MKQCLAPILLSAGLLLTAAAAAHDHPHATGTPAEPSVVAVNAPDVVLTDQDRKSRHLVSEWIGDRKAVISFTYSSCTTICPVLDNIFAQVQERLGSALGPQVVLLTVTVDPARDIPARLRARSNRLGASAGWRFLTGPQGTVNDLLRALEVYSADVSDHPPTVFVVDGAEGRWTRLNGFPTPEAILGVVGHGERTAGLSP